MIYFEGFNLTVWKNLNNYGAVLTQEQTKHLWRELGIEEYVGVGCSLSEPPYIPKNHPGWRVPTRKCKEIELNLKLNTVPLVANRFKSRLKIVHIAFIWKSHHDR